MGHHRPLTATTPMKATFSQIYCLCGKYVETTKRKRTSDAEKSDILLPR